MNWQHRIRIKHLFTKNEDYNSVQQSMTAIADELETVLLFTRFSDLTLFRSIPRGDDIFGPVDYANRLLDRLYDYADANSIWIE